MKDYYDLTISRVQPETANAVTLTFDVPDNLRETFTVIPGQHLKLKTDIGGEAVERFYSVCAFDESFVQVGIKKVDGGQFSTYACDNLADGAVLSVQPPQGDFHLPTDEAKQSAKRFCFLAAGSGITPILAMINSLLTEHDDKEVVLIYINPKQRDIMFFDELEDLKNTHLSRFSVVHVLTREPRDLPLLSARPDAANAEQLLDAFVGVDSIDHSYLCGPLPLIETFREALLSRGLDKKQVHMELFGTPDSQQKTEKVVHSDDDQMITVMSQGRSQSIAVAPGQNVLDAALEAGANVPFACKGGVCATCKAKLVEGEAEMTINYGLEDDEVEKGYMLTCQAHVTSETAVFDFDV